MDETASSPRASDVTSAMGSESEEVSSSPKMRTVDDDDSGGASAAAASAAASSSSSAPDGTATTVVAPDPVAVECRDQGSIGAVSPGPLRAAAAAATAAATAAASAAATTTSSCPTTTPQPGLPLSLPPAPGCGCITAAAANAVVDNKDEITVCITPTTGGQFDLTVDRNDTVENLKKIISKKLKVAKERICLLHRER